MNNALSHIWKLLRFRKMPSLHLYTGDIQSVPVHSSVITKRSIRLVEQRSIVDFVTVHKDLLSGRVLDFGAGNQPYKNLVSDEYVPFEKGETFPTGTFHAVLVNQVAQYIPNPHDVFSKLATVGEYLVMTYPTNWEEVEDTDIVRYTKAGMEKLLVEAGYEILEHEKRCSIMFVNFEIVIGYGVVAKSLQNDTKK